MGDVIYTELTELPEPLRLKRPLSVQLHWCCDSECNEVDAWCEPFKLFAIGFGSEEHALKRVGERISELFANDFARPYDKPGDADVRRAAFAEYVEVPA